MNENRSSKKPEPEDPQIGMFSGDELPTLHDKELLPDPEAPLKLRQKQKKTEKKSFSELCGDSLLISVFTFLANYISYLFGTCLTYSLFTSYDSVSDAFRNCRLYQIFSSDRVSDFFHRRKLRFMSHATEARIPKFFGKLFSSLLYVRTTVYGLIFLFFGLVTLFVHFVISPYFSLYSSGSAGIIFGFSMMFPSLFLLFSEKTVVSAVCESRMLSTLLFRFMGVSRSTLNEKDRIDFPFVGACLIGTFFGLLTVFVPAVTILLYFLVFILTVIIIKTPEAGLIFLLLLCPFAPISWILYITAVTDIVYIYKLASGKRTLHLEFMDMFVVIMVIMAFFGGLISLGESGNIAVPVIFTSAYLLTVNICRSRLWYNRTVTTVTVLGASLAVYSMLMQFAGKYLNSGFDNDPVIDKKLFANGALTSSAVLTFFMVMVAFYLMYGMFYGKTGTSRFIFCIFVVCTFIYLFFNLTSSAWVAVVFALILFLILRNKRNALYMFLALVMTPFLPVFRIYSVEHFIASFTYSGERLDTWNAVIRMLEDFFLVGGIGNGNGAFEYLYPSYFIGNTENAVHSGSLLMQLLVTYGIMGLLLFALTVFFVIQSTLSFGKVYRFHSVTTRMQGYAGMCGVIAAFIWGIGEYIWFDPRCMLFFWIIAALTVSARRSAISENLVTKYADSGIPIFSD